MKRFTMLLLLMLLIILMSTFVAHAQSNDERDGIDFEILIPTKVQTWEQDGATIIEVSRTLGQRDVDDRGSSPDELVVGVGGHTVEYASAAGYQGSSYAWHAYARTKKISGSGSYKTHAHAALIEGDSGGVEYSDPLVFGNPPTACAANEKTNATAQSCESPHFSTYSGQWWYIVSGHKYDVGANGTWDDTCSGCFDWKFEVP